MSTNLDDLLRSTLNARAETVTSGPGWDGVPEARRTRGPWLAVAAAAVTVLALAGGVVALTSGDDRTQTGGDAATACRTTLPAAWRSALAAAPLTVDGHPLTVTSVLADGRLLGSYFDAGKAEHLVTVDRDGGDVSQLATVPVDRLRTRVDRDGTDAVLSSAPKIPADSPDSPVDEIDVLNLNTGTTREILSDAPVPAGWIVAPGNSAGAVVQNGIVYLGVRPERAADGRGRIISYTIRTGKYAVVATTTDTDAVLEHDVRGVTWKSGSVRSATAPEGLPPFFARVDGATIFQPVVSDGRAAAWVGRTDPAVVHWTDGAGDVRSFTVRPGGSATPEPTAVSGRFVVLQGNLGDSTNLVLDATGGAFATTANEAELVVSGSGTLVFDTVQQGAVRVPTTSLPGLTC